MRSRWWRLGLLNALIFPVPTVLLFCAWLLGTTSGLQTSLHFLNYYYFSNKLSIGKANGRLLDGFQLTHIRLPLAHSMTALIGQATIHWHFDKQHISLFSKQPHALLTIEPLQLRHVSIQSNKQKNYVEIPTLNLAGTIDFDQKQVSITTTPAEKSLLIKANYTWSPHTHWQFEAQVKSFNGTIITPYLNALSASSPSSQAQQTDLHFLLKGQGDDKRLTVALSSLSGQFQQQAIAGYSYWKATVDGRHLETNTKINIGQSHIHVKGELSQSWNLHWQLSAAKLHTLFPLFQGNLNSQGQMTGPRLAPRIQAHVESRELGFKRYKVNHLKSNIDIDLAEQGRTTLLATIGRLSHSKYYINRIKLQGSGVTEDHTVQLHADLPQGKLSMQVKGKLAVATKRWSANLQQLDFLPHNKTQPWQLTTPASIELTPTYLTVNSLRWANNNASLTLSGQWQKKKSTQLSLAIEQMPLSQLLTEFARIHTFHLQGYLNTHLALEKHESQPPSLKGTLQITSNSGNIKLRNATIELGHLNGYAEATGNRVHYTVQSRKKSSYLRLNGDAYINQFFNLTNDDDATTLSQTTLEGQQFEVINSPTLQLTASPHLTVNLYPHSLKIQGVIVVPTALISPYDLHNTTQLTSDAIFVEDKLPSTAVTKQIPRSHKKKKSFEIYTNIKLELGSNVKFDFRGLEGRLEGGLQLIQRPNQPMLANGQLTMLNSTYTQYGETLTVSRGILNFVNSPLNNPQVDIIAERNFEDLNSITGGLGAQTTLKVGVKIYGRLHHPKTHLFSEPGGRSQSDILSMLVLGQSNVDLNNDDNKTALLLRAATAFNFGKNHTGIGSLANDLRHKLGLAELGVKSDTKINDNDDLVLKNTSIVLGKYLSPKLYIRYSRGLQEPLNTLNLIYSLSHHFKLQTQSNEEGNGMDMLYTFEKE